MLSCWYRHVGRTQGRRVDMRNILVPALAPPKSFQGRACARTFGLPACVIFSCHSRLEDFFFLLILFLLAFRSVLPKHAPHPRLTLGSSFPYLCRSLPFRCRPPPVCRLPPRSCRAQAPSTPGGRYAFSAGRTRRTSWAATTETLSRCVAKE